MDTAFEAFCAAGLWPGLGRTHAGRLAAAHINGPDDVTVSALSSIEGVSRTRAQRLVGTFADAAPRLAVARLLHAASLSVRPAFGAVEEFGRSAETVLRNDPWRLLDVPGVQVAEADRFALATLEERPSKDDPRRGRALVGYALVRAARDGHTVMGEDALMAALAGVGAPEPAVATTPRRVCSAWCASPALRRRWRKAWHVSQRHPNRSPPQRTPHRSSTVWTRGNARPSSWLPTTA
jgi:exodeoxyribonuclease V alpha subunit